jgi:hypothetical protein
MTDEDVAQLYRCLLNRAPETPDTVAAFRAYYPDFERGRRAILQSSEFANLFHAAHGDSAARLAQGFLRRAGGQAFLATTQNAALRGIMELVLRAHGGVHLAVVAGNAQAPLEDLLPLQSGHAAILHVAPEFPAFLPQIGTLPNGATVFRTNLDAPGIAQLLHAAQLRVDLLAVLEGGGACFDALQPHLSGQAILVSSDGFPAAVAAWPTIERPLQAGGLLMRFVGGWFLPVTYGSAGEPEPLTPIEGLCVAAIMRNERAAAPNMLASVAPVAASFVLVDTGSTDDTVPCVRDFLASTGKPFVLQSITSDRFDVMRNAALDLAPEGTEWVLMLDADEELCPEDHAALRVLLAGATHDAYALPRYNYIGPDKSGEVTPYPDRQVRLLRHRPDAPLRYSGAVHETVRDVEVGRLPLDAASAGQDRGGPHIHHLVRRFRSPEAEAAKQAFYREIAVRHE